MSNVLQHNSVTCATVLIITSSVDRDVWNRFFILVQFRFDFWKKLGFGSEWVWVGSVQKTWFSLDHILIYCSCNSWVVNLQQIWQWQWVWQTLTSLTPLTTTTTSKLGNSILKSIC